MGRGALRAEQNHQLAAGATDVAGANSKDGVAGLGGPEQEFNGFLHGAEILDVLVAGFANGGGQSFTGNAGDGDFTGGVNVRERQDVGLVEGAAEFVPEMPGAGEAMRLEEDQEAFELAAASGFEGGTDFSGMMAVVVDDGDVVDRALDVETAADAGEAGEAFADQVGRDVQVESYGGRGGGVADVVHSRRMRQAEDAQIIALVSQTEFAAHALQLDVADDQVGLGGSAIGNDGALDVGDDGLDVGFVQAKDGCAVEGDAVHKLGESILNVYERGVLVEVLAIDGGDDDNHRGEEQESAVAFIGFDDEVFAFAEARGSSGLIDATANHKGGIEVRGGENGGNHGGGGGLAMSVGNGDAVLEAHEFGKHFGARDYGNFALVSFDDLGIIGLDGRGGNDDVGAFDIHGFMPLEDGCAEILQALGQRGGLGVRARNGIAESEQNFSDAAHADAADADQVNALEIAE